LTSNTELTEKLSRHIATDLLNQAGLVIGVDDDLLGSGLLDSLSVMALVSFIEQEWKISVPPEDVLIENFGSIAAIDSYLARRPQQPTSPT
jgi:acyl carrier protein